MKTHSLLIIVVWIFSCQPTIAKSLSNANITNTESLPSIYRIGRQTPGIFLLRMLLRFAVYRYNKYKTLQPEMTIPPKPVVNKPHRSSLICWCTESDECSCDEQPISDGGKKILEFILFNK